MKIILQSFLSLALFLTLQQTSTGYETEGEMVSLMTGKEGRSTSPGSTISPDMTSPTTDPCGLQESADCYKNYCRADHPFCYTYLLMSAPEKLRVLKIEDYHQKPVAFLGIVDAIYSGLKLAVGECKHQFLWEPWNCQISVDAILKGDIFRTGTRQASFLQAISAAAVMHSVAKTCSQKENDLCKCGKISSKYRNRAESRGDHLFWGGCAENDKFGERVSEQFSRAELLAAVYSKLLNVSKRHNENVGRMVVKESVVLNCRCHGPTGSCAYKTCWTVLSKFRTIGDQLYDKYGESIRVKGVKRLRIEKTKDKEENNSRVDTIRKNRREVTKRDLVYFADSIDYCQVNYTVGNLGPVGMECFEDDNELDAPSKRAARRSKCDIMCRSCGHEVEKVEYEEIYECECQELWCCIKRCKHCTRKKTKYFCK